MNKNIVAENNKYASVKWRWVVPMNNNLTGTSVFIACKLAVQNILVQFMIKYANYNS